MAATALSNQNTLSPIFKLNTDCCDEIFEFLSLKDLHSLALTCKPMQKVTGEYFQRNHKAVVRFRFGSLMDPLWKIDNLSGFHQFTKCVQIYNSKQYLPIKISRFKCLNNSRGIRSSEFKSLNEIYLNCFNLDERIFEDILPQIEIVNIHECQCDSSFGHDFYDDFLKFCPNLKVLVVSGDDGNENGILQPGENRWLQQKYPSLQMVHFIQSFTFKINGLRSFLERNSTIQTFSTTAAFLWKNRKELLQSNIKLDSLNVQISDLDDSMDFVDSNCEFWNHLYERGFYKRLQLNLDNESFVNQFSSLIGLESLSLDISPTDFAFGDDCDLSCIKKLFVTNTFKIPDGKLLLPAERLLNLEHLVLNFADSDDLSMLISGFLKLRTIKINWFSGDLNLRKLNNERQKLTGAPKITIYVPENTFQNVKYSTWNGDLNLEFIEIKRKCDDDEHWYTFQRTHKI